MPELSDEELEALVEEATVDAYGDDEKLGGPPPKGAQWITAYRNWTGGM